jgi:hypothetical protein
MVSATLTLVVCTRSLIVTLTGARHGDWFIENQHGTLEGTHSNFKVRANDAFRVRPLTTLKSAFNVNLITLATGVLYDLSQL